MTIDFELTDEQQMFKDTIRDFGENEIAPLVEDAENNEKFPIEIFPKLGEMGFLGIAFPEEYGGVDLDKVTECIFAEEMGRINLALDLVHTGASSKSRLVPPEKRRGDIVYIRL